MVDAPCGDLNWMKAIINHLELYIGVDIVEEIIDRNKKLYTRKNINFISIDITKDQLPQSDLICSVAIILFTILDFESCTLKTSLKKLEEIISQYNITNPK
jgi:hypothetical protein